MCIHGVRVCACLYVCMFKCVYECGGVAALCVCVWKGPIENSSNERQLEKQQFFSEN